MATEFTPVFLLILIAIGIAVLGMVLVSAILSPGGRTPVKQMPYESGMDPVGDARQRFDVRYYLVAIAFLLFDVELLYLYPWAVAQWSTYPAEVAAAKELPEGEESDGARPVKVVDVRQGEDVSPVPAMQPTRAALVGIPAGMRNVVFGEILVFVAVLFAAYYYALKKGVFEWR
jgi:NADH-quinone oxidoreductase subunit A